MQIGLMLKMCFWHSHTLTFGHHWIPSSFGNHGGDRKRQQVEHGMDWVAIRHSVECDHL